MSAPVDPMANLENLYQEYATAVELANGSRTEIVSYWAPAPPPLTLTARV